MGFVAVVLAIAVLASTAHGVALITPTVSGFSTELTVWGLDRAAVHCVDGSGLTGGGHVNWEDPSVVWTTLGPYEVTDFDPYITFDLGGVYDVTGIREWGYNSNFQDDTLAAAGVYISIMGPDEVDVFTSTDGANFALATTVNFALAPGVDGYTGNDVAVNLPGVRYIKLDIMTNHDGAVFDGTGANGGLIDGRGLTGLSEIRFVPEPATLVLLGLGGLATLRRRRV